MRVKGLLSAVIIAAGAALVWIAAIQPVRCSRLELPLLASTERAIDRNDIPRARETLERAAGAIRHCPANIQLRMIAAANLRQLGRTTDAIRMYEEALRYDRRPELYFNIGESRVEAGMRQRAVDDYARAVIFTPAMIEDVAPDLQSAVSARVAAASHQTGVRNGNFGLPSPNGGAEYRGGGVTAASAALEWNVYISGTGSASTELVPSTRRPGGNMLHVVTNSAGDGVTQQWAPAGLGPIRVETEAWIFARRGAVQLATGNIGHSIPNAYTVRTGVWERIAAPNLSCPANFT